MDATSIIEPTVGCTPEQRDEWSALHNRISDLRTQREGAESMASHYLSLHVDAGAFAAGPFGIPSNEAVDYYRRACEEVAEVSSLRAEIEAVHEQIEAHPYTAEVRTRMERDA